MNPKRGKLLLNPSLSADLCLTVQCSVTGMFADVIRSKAIEDPTTACLCNSSVQ